MDCPGPPRCAASLLDWLRDRLSEIEIDPNAVPPTPAPPTGPSGKNWGRGSGRSPTPAPGQGSLFRSVFYNEDSPAIRTPAEFDGAVEHLEYAAFRRYRNQLTRAERSRLENSIENALFKVGRYVAGLAESERAEAEGRVAAIREAIAEDRERAERMRSQARRADLKISQLGSLSPEGFEEFVAEVFEALGFEVERCGGSGDEGVDLRVTKAGLRGIVQCKYFSRGVVGSPELQKFLGSVHHTRSHKGYYVTTRTYSLAAERFAADHPLELIDGPRLVELVQEAMGPGARREPEPALF